MQIKGGGGAGGDVRIRVIKVNEELGGVSEAGVGGFHCS